jgi:hypothetical protein
VLAVGAAIVSICLQGVAFWTGNHAIYLPYALRFDQLPQFATEEFYGTLHNFVSIYWWLMRQLVDDTTIDFWLWISHVVARVLLAFALLRFVISSGAVRSVDWLAALVLGTTPLLFGVSVVGGHNLFLPMISHSDFANAFALLAIFQLVQGKRASAFVLAGLTFDLNAFVGAWTVFALAAASYPWSKGEGEAIAWLRAIARPFVWFLLTASPVLVWTISAVSQQKAPALNYSQFLREYCG